LVHWLAQKPIFGTRDKVIQDFTEAWCIAKIRRLVEPLDPPVGNPDYEEEFFVAEHLESTTFNHRETGVETPFIQVGSLREELEKLPGPKISEELLDFIEYLLVIDHMKRPTALEALQHPYLQSLP
jgi:serine/threonine protein kinase